MSFYVNNEEPKSIYYNGNEVKSVYYNGSKVWGTAPTVSTDGVIVFYSEDGSDVGVKLYAKEWDGTLEYSYDNSTWSTYTSGTLTGETVYMRGIDNTKITGYYIGNGGYYSESYGFILTGNKIHCDGDIANLLDYKKFANGETIKLSSYALAYLFYMQENLVSAPEMSIISNNAQGYACFRMFDSCANLKQAPSEIKCSMPYDCYYMFANCLSLTIPPKLPNTYLNNYCYKYMFQLCSRLIEAPELPATTVKQGSYQGMFSGCVSLTEAPKLPATTIYDYCYYDMFSYCNSLTSLPELPSNDLEPYCYYGMFFGCDNVKLSETKTDEYTQEYSIPPTKNIYLADVTCLTDMFEKTGGTFTGTPEINTTYYLHKDCTIV